ncbi:hypothetical protein DPEC_G00166150 [Dallia pectoralis]|uniref:Uncharacterized protein n=1 Tax=Dallia pectoralis TaxID=75939 RepID=A0ACC2GHV6_DALPE|nr:hypothetical protein DPEC_G00166150 [Dallia pectoralis]
MAVQGTSLLENPIQAVLYLRELTTIVQNQQSLIQTQRLRIDELDRRVDELVGENKDLRVARGVHHHQYLDPKLHHHHPQHEHAEPHDVRSPPSRTQSEHRELDTAVPQPSNPETMQLVPAQPRSPSPPHGETKGEDGCTSPGCRTLVPLVPLASLTPNTRRSLDLARQSDARFILRSQTVLHQFCCPAPEALDADSIGSSRTLSRPKGVLFLCQPLPVPPAMSV